MITQPYHLYVERIAPDKDMACFYALVVQPTLFGEVSLVRAWGRIGTRGQQMVHLFDSESEAVSLFLDVLREKNEGGLQSETSCGHSPDLSNAVTVADDIVARSWHGFRIVSPSRKFS